jgi:choline/glycine/proline betaine transport protein
MLFYWAWWICWWPFVGMFIARIARGRSVKEFVLGVIFIPPLLSFIWMSVFGGSAMFLQSHGIADIFVAANAAVATAMFVLLEQFLLAAVLSLIAIVLSTVFFGTSPDSGSLVAEHLTSGGKLDSPLAQRVFWAVMEGVFAAVLLIGGGLTTLRAASVSTGLPFALVPLAGVYSLYVGFFQAACVENAVQRALTSAKGDYRMLQAASSVVHDGDGVKTA